VVCLTSRYTRGPGSYPSVTASSTDEEKGEDEEESLIIQRLSVGMHFTC